MIIKLSKISVRGYNLEFIIDQHHTRIFLKDEELQDLKQKIEIYK